jgi:hypothetical protein
MSLLAIFVFLVVFALQLVDRYLDLARKVSSDPLEHCPYHSSRAQLESSENSDSADQ